MMNSDLLPLANHIWQSTLFAAVVGVLTLALKRNRAAVRYWLWLAASVKFLIPFSLLFTIGGQLQWRSAPAVAPAGISVVLDQFSQPFTLPAQTTAAAFTPASSVLPAILFGVWLCGFAIGLIFWLRSVRGIRAMQRSAAPLNLNLPIPVLSCTARMEPGVFGIRKPALLLPAGITERLTPAQLQAVLVHELCHVSRKDNLTGAIHMVVELIFWFHPLVWWIRTQLVAERERACDEEVIRTASDPEIYAEGILNVCKLYLESPLPCVSGVGGGNLKTRIAEIMSRQIVHNLSYRKKALLAAAAVAALAGPITIGLLHTSTAKAQAVAAASIKPGDPDNEGFSISFRGDSIDIRNAPLKNIIATAYKIAPYQVSGPAWIETARFDIQAKSTAESGGLGMALQRLLTERFHLAFRRDTREETVYSLVAAREGSKLKRAESNGNNLHGGQGELTGTCNMGTLAGWLSRALALPVSDRTGLAGGYDFTLQYDAQRKSDGSFEFSPIAAALRDQLGLQLEPHKEPVPTLIIERLEQPSMN